MNADPIADMLTRIRNANALRYESVSLPYSKMKETIALIMKKEGYLEEVTSLGEGARRTLELTLRYGSRGERVITGLKKISKPGLRITVQADKMPKVLGGLGIAIVSTSKGILTDRECRKLHVGGEILCYVY